MASGNAVLVNFSGGETDPKGRGRFDAPWYATSARKILNFIVETLGPARYRPGFVLGWQTRRGAVGRIINFQISNDLGYVLEFTPGYMRVGLNNQLLTAGNFTITGITQASTAVVTFSSVVGLANGNEIILSGIVGMPQLNGRQVLLAGGSGNTFQIQDPVTGLGINTSALPAYVSGGIGALIYEITSPYTAVDLPSLQFATTGSLMYLVNPKYVPYKLTVDAYNHFTLSTYARTNDPFALATQAVTITDLRPIYLEDTRMGVGTPLTPAADTGASIAFTAATAVFTQADVGKYIRSFIAPSDTRSASTATLTPAATTGTGIVFTASQAVFAASDVGTYIRDLTAGASSKGYALITGYTSATQVTCTIITNFAGTSAIASGVVHRGYGLCAHFIGQYVRRRGSRNDRDVPDSFELWFNGRHRRGELGSRHRRNRHHFIGNAERQFDDQLYDFRRRRRDASQRKFLYPRAFRPAEHGEPALYSARDERQHRYRFL